MLLRAIAVAASALVAASLIGVAAIVPPSFAFVAAAATTVLVMGGTGNPLSTTGDTLRYVEDFTTAAVNNFVTPVSTAGTGIPEGPYNTVAVVTPEESAPTYGTLTLVQSIAQGVDSLDSCVSSTACDYNQDLGSTAPTTSDTFVVFGYSQSATIAMVEKEKLAAEYAVGEGPDGRFVVIGNNRPNGGFVGRDTQGIFLKLLLGLSRDDVVTEPSPTDTQYATVDIALQYDLFADAPLNPLNLPALLNAYMGMIELHPNYTDYSLTQPGVVDQGKFGDTHYYLISTDILPLLMPLESYGKLGYALADTLDPALRVIIESAYDRNLSPGVPTAWNYFYFENPIRLTRDFLQALPIDLDNGIQDIFGVRPLGTKRTGAYGVGGPEVKSTASGTTGTLNSNSASDAGWSSSSGTASSDSASSNSTSGLAHSRRPVSLSVATSSVTNSKKVGGNSSSSSQKPSTASAHQGVGSSKRAS